MRTSGASNTPLGKLFTRVANQQNSMGSTNYKGLALTGPTRGVITQKTVTSETDALGTDFRVEGSVVDGDDIVR